MLALILTPILMIGIVLLWVFIDLSMLRTKAAGAADLAALAGAGLVIDDPDRACSVAADVARRNGGDLTACTVEGLDIEVEVSVPSTGIAARFADWVGVTLPPVRQAARAGI